MALWNCRPDTLLFLRPRRYSPFLLVWAWLTLAQGTALAQWVSIERVGLDGRVKVGALTTAHVRVTNPEPTAQRVALRLEVMMVEPPSRRDLLLTSALTLSPHETRTVTVPLLVDSSDTIIAHILDPSGKPLGSDQTTIRHVSTKVLVALICREESVCQDGQTKISFVGTEEDRVLKRQKLGFVVLKDPPYTWWDYAGPNFVVVASPLDGLARPQRDALEAYVRLGGSLVIVEDLAGDPTFLAPYRHDRRRGGLQTVGRGKLLCVRGLTDETLGRVFAGDAFNAIVPDYVDSNPYESRSILATARARLATTFRFPSLTWVMSWLGAYILVVGLVNFTVLNRLGRREWGWITVPGIAILFAVALYTTNASKWPSGFVLDHIVVYFMDDRSPLAGVSATVRVTTPFRTTLAVSTPPDFALTGPTRRYGHAIFPPLNPEERDDFRLTVHQGDAQRIELAALKWSFADLEFLSVQRLPGSIAMGPSHRIRNDTGLDFIDSIIIHDDAQGVRRVGPLLSRAHAAQAGSSVPVTAPAPATTGKSVDLEELAHHWSSRNSRVSTGPTFIGLARTGAPAVDLPGKPLTRYEYVLVVVALSGEQ